MVKFSKMEVDEDKIEYMRSNYDDSEFIDFIDDIKSSELRLKLQEELKYYVPLDLRNNKNNAIKFGLRTRTEFVDYFKKLKNRTLILNGVKISTQEFSIETLKAIFRLWCIEKNIISNNASLKEIEELCDFSMIKLFEKQNKQKLITKETVLKFYRFNPFIQLDDGMIDFIKTFQYTDEDLEEIRSMERASRKKMDELVEQNKNLLEERRILLNDIQYYKNQVERLEVSDPQKMKHSLEEKNEKLENRNKELEAELKELKESGLVKNYDVSEEDEGYKYKYLDLQKTYNKIKDMKISDFDRKILSDKKYQQLVMSLILHNSNASKLLVKHLNIPDTVRELILEARSEISDLQKQKEEALADFEVQDYEMITMNKKQMDASVDKSNNKYVYKSDLDFSMQQYFKSLKENMNYIYEDKAQNINVREKIADANFIIADDEKILELLNMEKYNIPYCRVAVESSWHGIKDWFGYYNDNGEFVPASTYISDYYRFVRDNMDLPFGAIVFDNFNQIPPEIYVEPFIKSIEATESYQLIHETMVKDSGEFAKIEKLHNLKFIFIKSKNSTAFDIPENLFKYELGA